MCLCTFLIQYYSVTKITDTKLHVQCICWFIIIPLIHVHVGWRTGAEDDTDQVWSKGMSYCVPDNCYCWIYSVQVSVPTPPPQYCYHKCWPTPLYESIQGALPMGLLFCDYNTTTYRCILGFVHKKWTCMFQVCPCNITMQVGVTPTWCQDCDSCTKTQEHQSNG